MNARESPVPDPPEELVTLGDLLYEDKSKASRSEAEWFDVIRAIGSGNQAALRALYERTYRIVFTLTMRIVRDRSKAEELTVDAFHDVWRRAHSYDPENGSVLGWILNQARSRAIDRLRFDQRKKRVSNNSAAGPEETEVEATEKAIDLEKRSGALRSALERLTASERIAIETAFFGELTYEEAALQLNEPLGTIKTRIRSALHKLRHTLAPGDAAP